LFTCLCKTSKCDNFRIQCRIYNPFASPEILRREMCDHGIFLSIQKIWFFSLSIIHFGSHLPTKTFWSSKGILTIHQVWDRPPHLFFVFKLCPVHLLHHNQLHNNRDHWNHIVSHLNSFTSYSSTSNILVHFQWYLRCYRC